jgi:hypothetical protein
VKLRLKFDRLLDISHLDRDVRGDIYAAIEHHAETGEGADAAYRPPGTIERDTILVAGHEIDFRIDRSNPDVPVMLISAIEPSAVDDGDPDD